MKKVKILTLLFGAVLLSNEMYADEKPIEKVFPELPTEIKKISKHVVSREMKIGDKRVQNIIHNTQMRLSYQGVGQTGTIKDLLVSAVGAFITKNWNFFNELKVDPNSGVKTESRIEGNIYMYGINFDNGAQALWVCYDSITTNIAILYRDSLGNVLVSKVDLAFKFKSGVKFDYRNSKSYEELYSVKKNK